MEEKHHCKTSRDCIGERTCFQNTCIKECEVLTDCAADEFCSLQESDGKWFTSCTAEDTCSGEDDCPVGDVGAVCSAEFFTDRPAGCIKWGCVDADNCPSSWKCLVDELSDSRLGACSNGERGHPCRHDGDCNDMLVCDVFDNTCVDPASNWMFSEGMDE